MFIETSLKLEKMFKLLRDNTNSTLFYFLRRDYIDFIGSNKKIAPLIKGLILEKRISDNFLFKLVALYNYQQNKDKKYKNITLPLFYDKKIDEKFGLIKKLESSGYIDEEPEDDIRSVLNTIATMEAFEEMTIFQDLGVVDDVRTFFKKEHGILSLIRVSSY